MKNTKVIKIVIFSLLLVFSYLNAAGYAGASSGLWDSQLGMSTDAGEIGEAYGQSGEPTDFRIVLARLINIFLSFLGLIFLILILAAGFMWMTSGGSEEKVSKSKSLMFTAVIGLIIILMSYAIAAFVTECMYDLTTSGGLWGCKM